MAVGRNGRNLWRQALFLSQIVHTALSIGSYKSYLQDYQKDLHRLQNHQRQERYHENLNFLHELEIQLQSLNLSFSIRSNHFLDWFEDELQSLFHPISTPVTQDEDPMELLTRRLNANSEFNDELNWASSRNPLGSSILSPILNQGECGACWAFAAAEATTASLRLNGYPLITLSAQELVDCDVGFNSGCSGGNPALAYEYIMDHGITTALSLPYRGYEQKCYRNDISSSRHLFSSSLSSHSSPDWSAQSHSFVPIPVATIRKFVVLPSSNEFFLKEYVNKVGPVSVGICGTDPFFIYYGGGVFNSPDCCTDLNHAVVIVGYGTDEVSGLDYWIAQNSWGERWGEKGFIRLARSNGFFSPGQCGIAIGASIPISAHLLIPESELPTTPDSQTWEEWFDSLEGWSLSNIQDIVYAISALMLSISICLFCCGLVMDLYEFMKTCCQQRQQLQQQQVYSPVGDGMDDENRYQRISSVLVPVHAVPLAAYYQTPHYVTAQ